jgi:hypothetical protein
MDGVSPNETLLANGVSRSSEEVNKALITHLSKEIETTSGYIATLRSRMAFTVMIGPFVVLGSLAYSSKSGVGLHAEHDRAYRWIG